MILSWDFIVFVCNPPQYLKLKIDFDVFGVAVLGNKVQVILILRFVHLYKEIIHQL